MSNNTFSKPDLLIIELVTLWAASEKDRVVEIYKKTSHCK